MIEKWRLTCIKRWGNFIASLNTALKTLWKNICRGIFEDRRDDGGGVIFTTLPLCQHLANTANVF